MTGTCAIIPASGLGERLRSSTDKAFVRISGRPLIAHTLSVFQESPDIDNIILVVRPERIADAQNLVMQNGFSKVHAVIPGGNTRQESVHNGLSSLPQACDIVVIHDCARPFVTHEIIKASIECAREEGADIVAVPVIDTIKTSLDGRHVTDTLDRMKLYAVQTPQTFKREIVTKAYEDAAAASFQGTDDASLVERMGLPVAIVQGSYRNIKITTPMDIVFAEEIMSAEREQLAKTPKTSMPYVVGHGYDVHRFAPDRRLFLGGVEFHGQEGLLGHSDADVLLHAVADAVLGAAGAGDIGRLFPDTDAQYKDARSTVLLARVGALVREKGWQVVNVDVTLIAERPRVASHVPQMCANIAEALGISPESVNVKATTAEGLGFVGEGLGIECHAVALLTHG